MIHPHSGWLVASVANWALSAGVARDQVQAAMLAAEVEAGVGHLQALGTAKSNYQPSFCTRGLYRSTAKPLVVNGN